MHRTACLLVVGASAALWAAHGAQGAGPAVDIVGSAFVPPAVTIDVGDTVTWTNKDSITHSVTFADGVDSPDLQDTDTFARTFDQPGTYPYLCRFHPSFMRANVVVRAAPLPPQSWLPLIAR